MSVVRRIVVAPICEKNGTPGAQVRARGAMSDAHADELEPVGMLDILPHELLMCIAVRIRTTDMRAASLTSHAMHSLIEKSGVR